MKEHSIKGKVYLVGAGPGDPQMITMRGAKCLEMADVVIYDRLVNPEILRYANEKAELHYAGKSPGDGSSQEDITELTIREALKGKVVVRLKGGDPFLFARGAEEALALAEEGIPYELVPGVTSALAGPAYAGIPVTHRELASGVRIITGTRRKGGLNWEIRAAAGTGETLVVLMGMGKIDRITRELIKWGRSPDTPAAVIFQASRAEQRTLTGNLGNIAGKCRDEGLTNPAVVVIGDVTELRGRLKWFEKKPLSGKRILVTRPRSQQVDLAEAIEKYGGEVFSFPAVKILPPESYTPLDRACRSIEKYDMVIFTSVNGVASFFSRLRVCGRDSRALNGCRVVAMGPGTAGALRKQGIIPDIVPGEYCAEGIIERLRREEVRDLKILLPRAQVARGLLPEFLKNEGAGVEVVAAYRTVPNTQGAPFVLEALAAKSIDMITFTSSSCVRAFFKIVREEMGIDNTGELLEGVAFACIGPVTAASLIQEGFKPQVVAREYTVDGLVMSVVEYYLKRQGRV